MNIYQKDINKNEDHAKVSAKDELVYRVETVAKEGIKLFYDND